MVPLLTTVVGDWSEVKSEDAWMWMRDAWWSPYDDDDVMEDVTIPQAAIVSKDHLAMKHSALSIAC